MDLSINNINLKKNINFKGLEGAYNRNSLPVMRFYAPAHSKDEKVILEYAFLDKDDATAQYKAPESFAIKSVAFDETDVLELPQEVARKKSSGFGYRFKIVDKDGNARYELDSFKSMKIAGEGKTNAEKMNIIEQGRMYGVSPKGGSMRHSFLDSDVKLDGSGMRVKSNAEFARNHFNKLGGSLGGLNWLLENSDELDSYGYFMTTPDIGVDKVSSHRYWPANHYQCSDLDTFKDFNFNLFKKGKGYVADGAFTSQGIQSPLVQHVLKWGKESPFYDWLKIDGPLSLGVLPDFNKVDGVNPYEHIGVRLVNPKGEGYDKTKPTYIQFFDDRLLSLDRQVDGEFHFDYDGEPLKRSGDIYEITTHQDSVQPYAFEISPDDKKLKVFNGKRALLLKDIPDQADFLTFPNFTIGEKNKVAGATYWDGNVDIVKMNLSNPTGSTRNEQGYKAARQYLYGVADYWTETVQSHLILETAKSDKKAEIATSNGIDNKRLGQIFGSIEDKKFVSLVNKTAKTPEEIIKNFPLQSLETSEELSAIFAQPQFRKELLDDKTLAKLVEIFNSTVEKAIPEAFKDSDEYRNYVVKTYGNEIVRNIFIDAMCPKLVGNKGKIDIQGLKRITLKSFEDYVSNSPAEERAQVVSKIKKAINPQSTSSLQAKMKEDLASISLDDFKKAEAIVLQGKGGLNWRFDAAKDIGDLDAVRKGDKTFNQIWNADSKTPGVQEFWGEFVSRIRKYNPAAYVINEVTSLGEFCNVNDASSRMDFDPQLTKAWEEMGSPDVYELKPVYAKQVQFLNETNSTTTSEYSKGFNSFSEFAGVNPEKIKSNNNSAGDVSKIKKIMEELMTFNQPNSAIYSHMFVSNHDKPSVLHTLPLNMSAYLANDAKTAATVLQADKSNIVKTLLEGVTDYSTISPKALTVAIPMFETIEKLYKDDEETKNRLIKNLQNLVLGKKDDSSAQSFKRSEAFGVKSYEVTIPDLLKKAGIEDAATLEKETLKFHYNMMESSMTYFERMWQVMNACVGTPTLYGGNEFAQTGYETPSKNVYLGIRNEVLHGLKDKEGYSDFYQKMQKASGLYQQEGLSALRNGTPVSLNIISALEQSITEIADKSKEILSTGEEKAIFDYGKLNYFADQVLNTVLQGKNIAELKLEDVIAAVNSANDHNDFGIAGDHGNPEAFKKSVAKGDNAIAQAVMAKVECMLNPQKAVQIWPLYKKDSKGSETISIITNLGLPNQKPSYQVPAGDIVPYEMKNGIPLTKKDGKPIMENLPEGYVLKRVGDNTLYTIEKGMIKALDGSIVTLKDTVTTFYKAML